MQHAQVDFPVNSPEFQQELAYKLVPTGTGHLEFPAQEIISALISILNYKLMCLISNDKKRYGYKCKCCTKKTKPKYNLYDRGHKRKGMVTFFVPYLTSNVSRL